METLDSILEIAAIVGVVLFLWSVADSLRRMADAMAREREANAERQPASPDLRTSP